MKKVTFTLILLSLAIISFSQVDIKKGLVAHYPFNGNLNDSSGFKNNGTNMGVTPASNKLNQPNTAYFFSGDDDYVNVPATASIQPQNAVTVAAWVNTTDKDYWNFVVCKRLNLAKEPGNSYFLGTTGDVPGGATWQWSISSSTTQHFLVSNTLVEDSTWLHVVGTFNGDTLNLFLNGQNIGSKIIANTQISYSNLSLRLGLGIPTSSGNKTAFKGYIDEIRIYDRALSNDEIKYLYDPSLLSVNHANGLPASNLKLYPNPSTNKIFINTDVSLDKLFSSTVTITNVLGKEVYNGAYTTNGLDVSSLASGVYFITLNNFSGSLKFIKE